MDEVLCNKVMEEQRLLDQVVNNNALVLNRVTSGVQVEKNALAGFLFEEMTQSATSMMNQLIGYCSAEQLGHLKQEVGKVVTNIHKALEEAKGKEELEQPKETLKGWDSQFSDFKAEKIEVSNVIQNELKPVRPLSDQDQDQDQDPPTLHLKKRRVIEGSNDQLEGISSRSAPRDKFNSGDPNSKWKTLKHNGVMFPPAYEPHGIPILYDGHTVALTPSQEEWITYFAKYSETEHVKKTFFIQNFWKDWKGVLGKGTPIKDFSKVDFSAIRLHLEETKKKCAQDKGEKKALMLANKEKYGYAVLDGQRVAIGNYQTDPPGLFIGRGQHPKAGRFKHRIQPEQVTLNIGEGEEIPECLPGHKWGKIVHKHDVTWIASWEDNLIGQKYCF
eukprot:TRINITY_DN9603_c0_g1_i1.p1 TRINITY_DN9603_c0_g1~~TRINITY_DN9603_c0_g1_i1.p1  ORF type:complete len:388 (+),score=95.19 TRINITY_DN9603_c0_g1_i1:260-1423(+)